MRAKFFAQSLKATLLGSLVAACAPDWAESKDGPGSDPTGSSTRNDGGTKDGGGASTGHSGGSMSRAGSDNGPCKAGALRCGELGVSVEVCTVQQGWSPQELCDSVCTDGMCTGACKPGGKHCGLEQAPETCSAGGAWEPGEPCEFACTGKGVCAGTCKPGEKRCNPKSTKVPEECDETGSWSAGEACKSACIDGECGGSCAPGAMRCGSNNTPDKCNDKGLWEPQEACPFVCSGEGECGGECTPGARDCEDQTPRMCDQTGTWKAGAACSKSTCSMGMCKGQCEPNQARCGANETPEKCDENGAFAAQMKCQYVCSGEGECGGKCEPNTKVCGGAVLRTCKPDGSGYLDKECTEIAQKNESPACQDNDHCGSACVAPAIKCLGSPYCWKLPQGCGQCAPGYAFRNYGPALGLDRVCIPESGVQAAKDRMASEDAASASYFVSSLPGVCDAAAGAVYRNAYVGDLTCVPSSSATLAENRDSDRHTVVGSGAAP